MFVAHRLEGVRTYEEALEEGSTPKACAEADKAPGLRYDNVEPVPTTSLRRLRCESLLKEAQRQKRAQELTRH
jgi:hypothetical protein